MKKSLLILIVILFSVIIPVSYFLGYRGSINCEWIKIYNTHGGYRSWTVCYSHGQTWDAQGNRINLWKWPSFHHCDVRPFINQPIKPTG